MTDNPTNPIVSKLERHQDTPPQTPTMAASRNKIVEGTSAPVIYFDACPFYAFTRGIASITVTAQRRVADTTTGMVTEDRIITGLLRAPFEIMLQLRDIINEMERCSNEQLAAALAAARNDAPTGLTH